MDDWLETLRWVTLSIVIDNGNLLCCAVERLMYYLHKLYEGLESTRVYDYRNE